MAFARFRSGYRSTTSTGTPLSSRIHECDRHQDSRGDGIKSKAANRIVYYDLRVEWTGEFVFALGWLVLVLSIGAISLLNWLIRHSDAVNIASLFYLVPPCTALVAWLLFGEAFTGLALAGMALTVWGVYLARK